ncbi:MAG: hypothetical protein GY708_04465 [Actinomycetia bacterium]|nr:hypothetical protein [Actinomycetes bacterium]MCP4962110.1 hypothetical protein [Actinomycetes bacterium]
MSKKTQDANVDTPDRITRDDIEQQVRQLTGDVNDKAQTMSKVGAAAGAAALVALLIMIFVIGRSKGQKKTTIVEIVRV